VTDEFKRKVEDYRRILLTVADHARDNEELQQCGAAMTISLAMIIACTEAADEEIYKSLRNAVKDFRSRLD
jgi:hypothetical protein